ncbi:DUF761 domain-containing protein/DUF4408 domain-containing protein [Heracleum sosnowskyi]|uniref:DUF761 domain-containing protein/DUF4408 domain-containing protein n=1 Tax=Heracleum sosnowskyi TaxID=360622 RepID=A0AAD8HU88_9APIA|nr:DUF761 domain-containing protein/DUF4408 domain-containing protein [Heracleum sosnowskyi]
MNAESVTHTMLTQSVSNPSVWAAMNSWFTPTVFFVLLNLMVGTLLFNSNLLTQKQTSQQHQEDQDSTFQNDHHAPKLLRSPSLLKRLKSLNFRNFRSHEAALIQETLDQETSVRAHAQAQAQFILDQTQEDESPLTETDDDESEDEEVQSLDEVYSQLGHEFADSHFNRTTSETQPASGQVPAKLPTKMKKSASMKSPFGHFEESDIVEIRRPATVREKKSTEPDEEVDAKADDFINKFKQQLKLQRMNSIIRYKEVISRGSAK